MFDLNVWDDFTKSYLVASRLDEIISTIQNSYKKYRILCIIFTIAIRDIMPNDSKKKVSVKENCILNLTL